jgi:dethiobiotin synthetase
MAATRENRAVDFDALVAFSRGALASAKDMLLIEGIGGVMVPLDDRHTVLDWMAAPNIPVVLVAGSYLGSLSHTLTSLDALRRRDLIIKALVVNETPASTVPMADTVATLKRFAGSTPVVALPRSPTAANQAFADIAALL